MNSWGYLAGDGYKKKFFEYLERELNANFFLSAVSTLIPFSPRLLTTARALGLLAVVINAAI